MTSWPPFIPADLPVPLGDPGQYRRFAVELSRTSDELGRVAGVLLRESGAIIGVWRSAPSSARASGRLDALADLGRTWRDRAAEASVAVGGYATALEAAQGAVGRANHNLAMARSRPLGSPPSMLGLSPGERRIVDDADDRLRRLGVSDRSCAQTLHGCVAGEGRGSAAVAVRIQAADTAAGASPGALARRVHGALDQVPPDWITLEETIRVLGRLSGDPTRAATTAAALGADFGRLRRVCADALDPTVPHTAQAGFDAAEMQAALGALAQAAARAPALPRHAPPDHHPPPPLPTLPALVVHPSHPPPLPTPAAPTAVNRTQLRSALACARAQVGHPDQFAPIAGHVADGASFTAGIWAAAGVDLPDTAAGQFALGHRVGIGALRVGDLVFWTAPAAPAAPAAWSPSAAPVAPTPSTATHAPGVSSATGGGPLIARVAVYVGQGCVVVEPSRGHDVAVMTLDRADPNLVMEVVRLTSPEL